MTKREVAEFLRVTERTVDNLARRECLERFALGKRGVRFRRDEVEALLRAKITAGG